VLVALALVTLTLATLAQMSAAAIRVAADSRSITQATTLAFQKIEQLRALTWTTDPGGGPVSDTTTDISVTPENRDGGMGLTPSTPATLTTDIAGSVDYVDRFGGPLRTGATPPAGAVFRRRWSIEPLTADPADTLVIRVRVSRIGDEEDSARPHTGATLATIRTRTRP
jgi:hypothetical protein